MGLCFPRGVAGNSLITCKEGFPALPSLPSPPLLSIRESDLILNPIIIIKRPGIYTALRSSALPGRWAVKVLLDTGKLRHAVSGMELRPSQKPGLGTRSRPIFSIVLGAPWAPLAAVLTRADQGPTHEHMVLSLISREGGESHRTRPGLREEPVYFLLSHFYHPPFRSAAPLCIFQRSELGNIFRNGGN